MNGKQKGGSLAQALGALADAARQILMGPPAPVLRPIPVRARRPNPSERRDQK